MGWGVCVEEGGEHIVCGHRQKMHNKPSLQELSNTGLAWFIDARVVDGIYGKMVLGVSQYNVGFAVGLSEAKQVSCLGRAGQHSKCKAGGFLRVFLTTVVVLRYKYI